MESHWKGRCGQAEGGKMGLSKRKVVAKERYALAIWFDRLTTV